MGNRSKTPWKEGKGKVKILIKDRRPVSWLNIDLNTFSKASAGKLESVILPLITSQKTGYIQNRYTGEGERLISNILGISDKLTIDGYLVTVDIIKTLNSLYHGFLCNFKEN